MKTDAAAEAQAAVPRPRAGAGGAGFRPSGESAGGSGRSGQDLPKQDLNGAYRAVPCARHE